MSSKTTAPSVLSKVKFSVDPGVRTMLECYITERNAVIAPAKLTITGIVNEAIREYIERRTDNDQEAA